MTEQETYFAQHLASNDKRVRDKALSRLRRWLKLRSQTDESDFSDEGMMKLWKGLFYCMWMADKSLVQEELADNIGSLIHSFAKPSQCYRFVGAFFRTLGRSHDHIDKFRIDKFLMFTRRFFRASLQYLKGRNWEYKHVQKYISVLSETVLSRQHDARNMALGFRLHFLDIFLEELARVADGELSQKRAHNFLQPFYEVLAYCKSPMVVEGVRDKVFFELVKLNCPEDGDLHEAENGGAEASEDEVDDEEGGDGIDDEGDITENQIRRIEANGKNEDDDDDDEGDDSEAEDEDLASEGDEAEGEDDENAPEVHLKPIDFDMAAIKATLHEYSRVEGIKALNRKAITLVIKKLIDLENGVNPFATPIEDSGSDLEMDDEELKMAARRFRLYEKQCAEEAEKYLIPERDPREEDDEDEFEMEGGEDDMEEFEQAFSDHQANATRANGKDTKKAGKKDRKRKPSQGDHMMSDSDEEHLGEIQKEINELNFKAAQGFTKKKPAAGGPKGVVKTMKQQNGAGGDRRGGGHLKKSKPKHLSRKKPRRV